MSDLAKGLLITIGGVLVLTPDSLLIRLSATDPWNLIFWRGLLYSGAITAGYLLIARGRAWRAYLGIGRAGLAAAFFFSLNAFTFALAMDNTSVANVLVLIATSPLFSGIFSYVFLKERLPLRTWAAIFACLGGVAVIALPNIGGGAFFGRGRFHRFLCGPRGVSIRAGGRRTGTPRSRSGKGKGKQSQGRFGTGHHVAPCMYRQQYCGYCPGGVKVRLTWRFLFLTRPIPLPFVG